MVTAFKHSAIILNFQGRFYFLGFTSGLPFSLIKLELIWLPQVWCVLWCTVEIGNDMLAPLKLLYLSIQLARFPGELKGSLGNVTASVLRTCCQSISLRGAPKAAWRMRLSWNQFTVRWRPCKDKWADRTSLATEHTPHDCTAGSVRVAGQRAGVPCGTRRDLSV